jgi:hypothetical protein
VMRERSRGQAVLWSWLWSCLYWRIMVKIHCVRIVLWLCTVRVHALWSGMYWRQWPWLLHMAGECTYYGHIVAVAMVTLWPARTENWYCITVMHYGYGWLYSSCSTACGMQVYCGQVSCTFIITTTFHVSRCHTLYAKREEAPYRNHCNNQDLISTNHHLDWSF